MLNGLSMRDERKLGDGNRQGRPKGGGAVGGGGGSLIERLIQAASHLPGNCDAVNTWLRREREREIYIKSHISWWEHSSHFRLIGRGVPSVSVISQLVYKFLCLASPKDNPQVPI